MTETIDVIVEIPKGSRNKYEYDEKNKCFRLDRMLFSSIHYPCDYGFVPNTLARDGDPLDVLVLVGEPTFPGCHIEVKPVALFEMADEKGPDEKVLSVPINDPMWNHINALSDVPYNLLQEIQHFFTIYKNLENKKTIIDGWRDGSHAWKAIERALKANQEK